MENKKVGWLILGIAAIITFIIGIFNYSLRKIIDIIRAWNFEFITIYKCHKTIKSEYFNLKPPKSTKTYFIYLPLQNRNKTNAVNSTTPTTIHYTGI